MDTPSGTSAGMLVERTAWQRFGPALLAIAARSNYQEEDGTLRPDWPRRGILAAAAALRGPVPGSDRLYRDLVWELDPGHLPGLEAECRRSVLGSYTWYGFRAADLARYLDLPLALGAFTWHPDGFLRQAALQALPDDPNAVPFVILRLNDWVPEIRSLARTRMESLLDPARAPDLVRWLPLILWLETCGRADHVSTVRRVLSLLRRPECREALEKGLALPWRRRLYPLALQAADDPEPLLDRALDDPSPAVASWAARRVRHRPPNPERSRRMRASRLASVRVEGVNELAREDPEAAEGYLLDPHPVVRSAARHVLGPGDYAEHYGRVLAERPATVRTLKAALAGLGETGRDRHAPQVEGWLPHAHPGVRRAAARALGLLEGDPALLLPLLGDPSPGVARAADEALHRQPSLFAPEVVFRTLSEAAPPHALPLRMAALRRCGKWTALPSLVEAAGVPEWTGPARAELEVWFARYNSTSVPPTPADLDRLEEALDARPRALPAPVEASLRQIAASWRRLLRS